MNVATCHDRRSCNSIIHFSFQNIESRRPNGRYLVCHANTENDFNVIRIQDAALYVSEGEKDAKIFHHPTGYWSKKAFKILHHPVYYVAHLIFSLLLMFLAPVETQIVHGGKKTILLVSFAFALSLLLASK